MKIKPLFDRVLLMPVPTAVSEAGIYIPHEATERSQFMTVMEVGDGVPEKVVAIGDQVLISKYAGTEVVSATEKFYVLNQYDILAILKEEK